MRETASPDMILNRMRESLGARSDSELARKLGVSQQSLSSARTKDRVPDSWVRAAAERFGLSADWLLFGLGTAFFDGTDVPMSATGHHVRTAASPAVPDPAQPERLRVTDGEIVMVPMVEARLSAGGGSFETSGSVERHYAFRTDFLRRKGQIAQMVLMRVDGNSMAPEIQNGDAVLIDRSQSAPRPGGIYAVSVEDLIYLKIVNAEPGKLCLTSYNPAYAPIIVDTREQLESTVQIVGRVVWLGREFF
jgi:Predicted transcriptional regulator